MILWSRVDELRDEVGAEDFGEVVDIFLEEVDEVVSRLKSGASPDALEQDLHFLKGSALSLGFEAFARLCHDGEQHSGAGRSATVDVAAIVDCFDRSRTAFLAGLALHEAA